jgi:hypothetical protein
MCVVCLNAGLRLALPLAVAGLVLSGCSGDDEPGGQPSSTGTPTPTAPEVEVPDGVELTEAGTELAIGEPASAIFAAGPARVSTIELTVTRVVKGSMERDFTNFGLSPEQRAQEPYYVTVEVTNTGPAALGGATPPVRALDSTDTYFPPTSLVGNLPACQGAPLPKPFDTGESVTTCLLFIAEPDTTVTEIQLRPYAGFDPVSWAVPESVELAAERRERAEEREREREGKPGKPGDDGKAGKPGKERDGG